MRLFPILFIESDCIRKHHMQGNENYELIDTVYQNDHKYEMYDLFGPILRDLYLNESSYVLLLLFFINMFFLIR